MTNEFDGFELTGEFRVPEVGEYFWSLGRWEVGQKTSGIHRWHQPALHPFGEPDRYPCIILRKKPEVEPV